MNNLKNCIRDQMILDSIAMEMENAINLRDVTDFSTKADKILEGLKQFKKVLKAHRRLNFPYTDVLNTELSIYDSGHVSYTCVFDGKMSQALIERLPEKCAVVVKKDALQLPTPKNLKIGNGAIGQAWLEDGTEVFSLKEAINHSMNSTAKMLKDWSINYKSKLIKELR